MLKVNFDYNIKKDAWSWVLIAKSKNLWGLEVRDQIPQISDELLRKIKKASFSRAQKIVEDNIKKEARKKHKNRVMYLEMQALEKSWRIVEKKYFKTLSKVTQKPIFRNNFSCYFTTGFVCPYDEKENWFMVSMWHSIPFSITTICHEIIHLQFLHHYKDYLKDKGLKTNQIEDLKEAMTFLLNEPEFGDIVLSQDGGYPEHQKMRERLRKIRLKERDFQKFLDRSIKELYSIE